MKRRSRSHALGVAAAALVAVGVSACGGSSSSSDHSGSSGKSGVTDLTMLTGFTGPDAPWYKTLVADFNRTHPSIHVSMSIEPWAAVAQKLPESWATGQGPDIATPNSTTGAFYPYVKNNSALPLTSDVGTGPNQIDTAAWPKGVRAAFSENGQLYAVPANVATLSLYYNKAMFAKAGISGPPTTEAQLISDAKRLTITQGGRVVQYGISLADHDTIQMWPILLWMDGGGLVGSNGCATINSPTSVASLTKWTDLIKNDHISPVGQAGADADTLFAAKKAAMEINGPWAAPGYRQVHIPLGIAPVPAGTAGKVTLLSTVPLVIERTTKHPVQAKEFLAWWVSKSAQSAFVKVSDYTPVRTDLPKSILSNPTVKVFASSLSYARIYLPGLPSASQIDTNIFDPLIESTTRGSNVQSAADSAAKQINALTGCKSSS